MEIPFSMRISHTGCLPQENSKGELRGRNLEKSYAGFIILINGNRIKINNITYRYINLEFHLGQKRIVSH